MSPKVMKFTIGILLVGVLSLAFGTGYRLGNRANQPGEGVAIVDEAWNIVFADYVDKGKLDSKLLGRAAIEGILKQLDDPYTSYLDAREYKLGMSNLEGEFDGIGAYVGMKDGQPTIIAPIPNSPAAKADVRAGDIILEVNGKPTSGTSLADTILAIRGPRGTPVKLLILHQGESKPVEIEIIRDKVEVPSARFEMKEDFAYIYISQFSERTDAELAPMLQSIIDQNAKGIVLDLRSNPGGLLETVINVASHFLTEGVVVNVVSNRDQRTVRTVASNKPTTSLPMVVLTDNYSASGSEVLAGALQDYGRATIAGTTTFGKGSVNILRQLSDGSGLYITTARWLTPKGRLIEGKGIDPDPDCNLELKGVKGDEAVQWAIDHLKGKK